MPKRCAAAQSSADLGYGPEIARDDPDPPAISVLGSVALDTIETPEARRERILGGSATYFAAAARLFAPVRIVSVVGGDFRRGDEAELEALGVDLSQLTRLPGRTYAWHGSYGSDFANATTVAREVGVIADYVPAADLDLGETGLFLGAMDPRVQRQVLDSCPTAALSALDSRESWIGESPAAVLELAARVDLVFLNGFELAALTGCRTVADGARALLDRGAGRVIVKSGADGASLYGEDGVLTVPAHPTSVVDPTGAGDAFAGGFLGSLGRAGRDADTESLGGALCHGAALASFALESLGIEALAQLTREQLDQRAEAVEWSRGD